VAGLDAFGTQLKRGDGAGPEVFTAIARVSNISPPSTARETYDVTAHDSPDAWREFIGGLKDGGEVSIDVQYTPSVHDVLLDDYDDDEPRNYQVVFPDTDATTWSFAAVMNGFSSQAPVDDKLSATITFKVSGKPVLS